MPELETKIGKWRARMTAALPGRDEAVTELEEHLRDHIEALKGQGKTDDEAFALAQERLGDPNAVAREFDRMPGGWPPASVLLPLLALLLAFLVGYVFWKTSQRLPITPLRVMLVGVYLPGLFCVLASGLIAASAFAATWRRPLRERELWAVRRLLKGFARIAIVSIPIAGVLNIAWASSQPSVSLHWSYYLQVFGIIFSVLLTFLAQSWPTTGDRVRWISAIFASFALLFLSIIGLRFPVLGIPVALVGAAFLLAQVFLVVPRFSTVRVR